MSADFGSLEDGLADKQRNGWLSGPSRSAADNSLFFNAERV
jgi:hypothetical protein